MSWSWWPHSAYKEQNKKVKRTEKKERKIGFNRLLFGLERGNILILLKRTVYKVSIFRSLFLFSSRFYFPSLPYSFCVMHKRTLYFKYAVRKRSLAWLSFLSNRVEVPLKKFVLYFLELESFPPPFFLFFFLFLPPFICKTRDGEKEKETLKYLRNGWKRFKRIQRSCWNPHGIFPADEYGSIPFFSIDWLGCNKIPSDVNGLRRVT